MVTKFRYTTTDANFFLQLVRLIPHPQLEAMLTECRKPDFLLEKVLGGSCCLETLKSVYPDIVHTDEGMRLHSDGEEAWTLVRKDKNFTLEAIGIENDNRALLLLATINDHDPSAVIETDRTESVMDVITDHILAAQLPSRS